MTTIIIPTYNERKNITPFIERVFSVQPQVNILVVDDNSPDGTGMIVAEMAHNDARVRLLSRAKKEGLGRAYLHAFQELLKDPAVDAVIMMDADFSHDPQYIADMLSATHHADVVVGSRYVPGGSTEGWETWRVLLSSCGNLYARFVTGVPVRDMTGGFNFIPTAWLRKINLEKLGSSGYAFQMELKHALWKKGARLSEVPIIFRNRREGESKISRHIVSEGLLAPWKMRFKKDI